MDIQKGVENSIANAKYPPPLKKKKVMTNSVESLITPAKVTTHRTLVFIIFMSSVFFYGTFM